MKSSYWFLPLFLSIALFGGVRPTRAAFIPGDVNGDTHFDAKDVQLVLEAALGLTTLTPDQMAAADLAPSPGVGPKAETRLAGTGATP